MHRLMRADGTYYQSKFLRFSATVSYLLFAISGLMFLISDLLVPTYGITAEVMAWFLMIGGALSSIGSATMRWVGEFLGLPLLGTSLVVLGMEILGHSYAAAPLLSLGNVTLLSGIAGIMVTRWRMVVAIYWVAWTVARRHE